MTAGEEVVPRSRTWPVTGTAWAVVVVYCWIVGSFESFTWRSTIAVLVPGLTVFAIGIGRSPSRRPEPRPASTRGVVAWAVPLLSFCVLEIVDDLVLGSTHAHPTLSDLMDPILDVHVWRSFGYLVWFAVGWALVKR